MNEQHFDSLTRALANGVSRRQVLKTVAVGIVSSILNSRGWRKQVQAADPIDTQGPDSLPPAVQLCLEPISTEYDRNVQACAPLCSNPSAPSCLTCIDAAEQKAIASTQKCEALKPFFDAAKVKYAEEITKCKSACIDVNTPACSSCSEAAANQTIIDLNNWLTTNSPPGAAHLQVFLPIIRTNTITSPTHSSTFASPSVACNESLMFQCRQDTASGIALQLGFECFVPCLVGALANPACQVCLAYQTAKYLFELYKCIRDFGCLNERGNGFCSNNVCCGITETGCGSTCCSRDDTCIDGTCCPDEQICGNICADPSSTCCHEGTDYPYVCAQGHVCCGNQRYGCCGLNEVCCRYSFGNACNYGTTCPPEGE